jgi:hypothetical protein
MVVRKRGERHVLHIGEIKNAYKILFWALEDSI